MEFIEKTLSSVPEYKSRIFSVRHDIVRLVDGNETSRDVVDHNGGVCIAPVDAEGNVYLVEQYRYPMRETTLELPAGKLEPGEDPDAAIARELREETGFHSDRIQKLGVIYPTPGFCTEKLHLYYSCDLVAGEQELDEDEFLNVRKMPLNDALNAVMTNEIKDGKTVALLLMVARMLQEK